MPHTLQNTLNDFNYASDSLLALKGRAHLKSVTRSSEESHRSSRSNYISLLHSHYWSGMSTSKTSIRQMSASSPAFRVPVTFCIQVLCYLSFWWTFIPLPVISLTVTVVSAQSNHSCQDYLSLSHFEFVTSDFPLASATLAGVPNVSLELRLRQDFCSHEGAVCPSAIN